MVLALQLDNGVLLQKHLSENHLGRHQMVLNILALSCNKKSVLDDGDRQIYVWKGECMKINTWIVLCEWDVCHTCICSKFKAINAARLRPCTSSFHWRSAVHFSHHYIDYHFIVLWYYIFRGFMLIGRTWKNKLFKNGPVLVLFTVQCSIQKNVYPTW